MLPGEIFKLVDDKSVSCEVELMVWAPKMDLIALANSRGEVTLHRLSWQKVWTKGPPDDNETVGGLAWRPDSKVLAVGYSSGKIRLYDIEKGDVLHESVVEGEVTCMCWTEHKFTAENPFTSEPYGEDTSANYLPKLQPLNKNDSGPVSKDNLDEVVEDRKKLKDQKELNFLVVGTNRDSVLIMVYGVFPLASASFMIQDGSQERRVTSAILTDDLFSLSAIVESTSDESDEIDYYILNFDTALIKNRHKEVRKLALKYGLVCSLVEHLEVTIEQMSEAWEDILTEMDSKLMKFAEEKRKSGNGTVCNDFLELLLFGTPSPELQYFLLHDLTDKGLKKLGFSIETSYNNIQMLVVKHLQAVSQSIMYHLSELNGMALWHDKFGILGLDPQKVQAAISATGTFILCTSDLQQVIDGSKKNFKAFFRWLYVVILRLSKEDVPSDLGRVNQQHLDFVAEFLRENFSHFDPDALQVQGHEAESSTGDAENPTPSSSEGKLHSPGRARKSRFKMEKVGQYLRKDFLSHPSNLGKNPWVAAIRASPALQNSSILYPIEEKKSLFQLLETMETKLESALNGSAETLSTSFQCGVIYHLFTINDSQASDSRPLQQQPPKFCQFTRHEEGEKHYLMTVFISNYLPHTIMHVLKQPTDITKVEEEDYIAAVRCMGVDGPGDQSLYAFLDMGWFDDKYVTLLLASQTPNGFPVLKQFPIASLKEKHYVMVNTTENITGIEALTSKTWNVGGLVMMHGDGEPVPLVSLDNMRAHSMAVSVRKLAIILHQSRRRVRLLMVEDEDEEDNDDEDESEMDESKEGGVGNESSSLPQRSGATDAGTTEEEMEDWENKENTSTSSTFDLEGDTSQS